MMLHPHHASSGQLHHLQHQQQHHQQHSLLVIGLRSRDSSRQLLSAAAAAPHTRRQPARLFTPTRAAPQTGNSAATTAAAPAGSVDMQERMQFLQRDLMHLFDDRGVDESQYDDVVTFLDPITKYNNVQGYMFNIRMLKAVFAPIFELHDIKQTAPLEATTRWTMTMKFTPATALGLSRWWDPVITFTGTSCYGFNPANGRINKHVDTWDSIGNQQFFSLEAFGDFWRQLLATYTTPQLGTPEFTLLRRTAKFQVRQYKPFIVAETQLDNLDKLPGRTTAPPAAVGAGAADMNGNGAATTTQQQPQQQQQPNAGVVGGVNPASAGMKAFNSLAQYIFGPGNATGTKMAMTTPVFSSTAGTMAFVVQPPGGSGNQAGSITDLPAPRDPSVRLARLPGGVFAAAVFNGVATPRRCAEVARRLQADLQEAGLRVRDPSAWALGRYNDPSVKPPFRRNEVLMELQGFDLWAPSSSSP